MNDIYQLPAQDARSDEASIWVTKLDKGLSGAEERALEKWLSESTANHDVFFCMAKQWDRMDSLSRLSDIFPHTLARQRKSPRLPLAIAASVVLAAFGGMLSVIDLTQRVDSEVAAAVATLSVYETAVGEQSAIVLSDGTEILLNTNSLIRVTYSDQHRLLTLERGELHVRVAHEPFRPLSVIANDRIFQAVGTRFNLEITTDQQIELVVTEGAVLVGVLEGGNDPRSTTTPTNWFTSSLSVSAGEEIVLGSLEEELRTIEAEDIEVKLSWREGNLIFRGESLEEAMTEIGRYTSVEFVFLDEEAKRIRVAGLFRAGDVKELLIALRENFNITYERVGNYRILLSSR